MLSCPIRSASKEISLNFSKKFAGRNHGINADDAFPAGKLSGQPDLFTQLVKRHAGRCDESYSAFLRNGCRQTRGRQSDSHSALYDRYFGCQITYFKYW